MGSPPKPEPPGSDSVRNVIMMIGDGMGPVQVEIARRALGGELAMDRLDANPDFITTDDVDGNVTDSAAAATALATGVKTFNGGVGIDADGNPVETALERAESLGKSSGIITDVAMACATPAAFTAHTDSRSNRTEIALQQVANEIEVMLGSGRENYIPGGCCGTGGPDLIQVLIDDGYEFVTNAKELSRAKAREGKLLGFFGGAAMPYILDQQNDAGDDSPTLAELTAKAIEVLNRNPNGFFLMVEGGSIDWVAHNRDAAGARAETLEFDEAVQVALDFANSDGETLVIATADHDTGGMALDDPAPLNEEFLDGITATTDFIWGKIMSEMMTTEEAMKAFAGIGARGPRGWPKLDRDEKDTIDTYRSMGIADVLSARLNVTWRGCNGDCPGVGSEEGDHTRTLVPVFAGGLGSEAFEGVTDNAEVGQLLLEAVGGN